MYFCIYSCNHLFIYLFMFLFKIYLFISLFNYILATPKKSTFLVVFWFSMSVKRASPSLTPLRRNAMPWMPWSTSSHAQVTHSLLVGTNIEVHTVHSRSPCQGVPASRCSWVCGSPGCCWATGAPEGFRCPRARGHCHLRPGTAPATPWGSAGIWECRRACGRLRPWSLRPSCWTSSGNPFPLQSADRWAAARRVNALKGLLKPKQHGGVFDENWRFELYHGVSGLGTKSYEITVQGLL